MKIYRVPGVLVLQLLLASLIAAQSVTFEHDFVEGEMYRIVGTNRQSVYGDNELLGATEELIRVQVEVLGYDGERATLHTVYQMAVEGDTPDGPFQFDREFDTTFTQDSDGVMTVGNDEFVPQVRDVPLFPAETVAPGHRWSRPATEVYDFRAGFDIPDPVRIPIDVSYTYRGSDRVDDRPVEVIDIRYSVFHRPDAASLVGEKIRLITGTFSQRLYWDAERGRAYAYEEEFEQFIQLANGARFEFRGDATGRVVDAPRMDRRAMEEEIRAAIDEERIEGARVSSNDEGVIIAIENIRFAPDSARILPQEIEKLEFIGSILRRYGDRDILITGHTALAGSEEGRLILSQERAAAVGEFFIDNGVRTRDRLVYRGVGATEPVASNDTEEGRRQNRRVEITILEN